MSSFKNLMLWKTVCVSILDVSVQRERASARWTSEKTHRRCVYHTAVLWAVEQTGCGQIKCLWILSMSLSGSEMALKRRHYRWFIHYIKTCALHWDLHREQREGGKSGQVTKKKWKAVNENSGWWDRDRTTHPLSLSCFSAFSFLSLTTIQMSPRTTWISALMGF